MRRTKILGILALALGLCAIVVVAPATAARRTAAPSVQQLFSYCNPHRLGEVEKVKAADEERFLAEAESRAAP